MTRMNSLTHEFVTYIPETLDEGMLYVSIPFATIAHMCCCGCGNEVVTPLDPDGWKMTFDGKTISLSPSIGNWGLDCQSHYWISRNQVLWARHLPNEVIASGRDLSTIKRAWRSISSRLFRRIRKDSKG